MKIAVLAAVAVMFLATPVLAAGGHCDEDLKAVDAAMTKAKLSDCRRGEGQSSASQGGGSA